MKRKVIVILILFLTLSANVQAEEMKIGYFTLAPHIIKVKDGKPAGATYEYFQKYVIPELSKPVKWESTETPLARLIIRLKQGSIAFAPFLLKHPDREKFMHYAKNPYFLTTPSILVRPDFPIKDFKEMSDLEPYTIGFYLKGVLPPLIEKELNIKRVGGAKLHKRLISMLQAKRVDGVLDLQQISLEFMKKKYNFMEGSVLPLPVPEVRNFFTASKASVSAEFFDEIEKALMDAPPYSEFVKNYIKNYNNFAMQE